MFETSASLNQKMGMFIKEQKIQKNGLQYMKERMINDILPILRSFTVEAIEYRSRRDINNRELIQLMHREHKKVNDALSTLPYVSTRIMSSIGSQLNLADGDSDIDIGILIEGLNNEDMTGIDMHKYEETKQKLLDLKYVFDHVFNPTDFSNQYYSFTKIIDVVEFELKSRDFESSKPILALHDYLDNKLTNEEITLFTYAKYMLKQYDKACKTSSYNRFKKVLYEYAFSHVEGGFVFPDPDN